MALVPPDCAATVASGMMLMRSRNRRQASTSSVLIPRATSRSASSRAMIAVPSTAAALVSHTRSPVRMLPLSISSDRRTVPAIIPQTTGRVTASVISVCPPHRVMRHLRQNASSSPITRRTMEAVLPTGKRRVVSSHRGRAPAVTMSLALTRTAYWPMASVAKVMGSDLSTSTSSEATSTAAMSSPTRGVISSEGSWKSKSASNSFRMPLGIFPAGSGVPSRRMASSRRRSPMVKSTGASGTGPGATRDGDGAVGPRRGDQSGVGADGEDGLGRAAENPRRRPHRVAHLSRARQLLPAQHQIEVPRPQAQRPPQRPQHRRPSVPAEHDDAEAVGPADGQGVFRAGARRPAPGRPALEMVQRRQHPVAACGVPQTPDVRGQGFVRRAGERRLQPILVAIQQGSFQMEEDVLDAEGFGVFHHRNHLSRLNRKSRAPVNPAGRIQGASLTMPPPTDIVLKPCHRPTFRVWLKTPSPSRRGHQFGFAPETVQGIENKLKWCSLTLDPSGPWPLEGGSAFNRRAPCFHPAGGRRLNAHLSRLPLFSRPAPGR